MVLESIVKLDKKSTKPFDLFYVGLLFATVGVLLSLWTFKTNPSIILVFFTTMIGIPLIYKLLRSEEVNELNYKSEGDILRFHEKAVLMYFFLFLGITLAFFMWYYILPDNLSSQMFTVQNQTIHDLNKNTFNGKMVQIFGGFNLNTGNFLKQNYDTFLKIVSNNIRVLIFSLIFSLIFGVGALFILVWNGSVLAAAFSSFFNKYYMIYMVKDYSTIAATFMSFYQSTLRYLIHGLPELFSYLLAGFAGGILSAAIVNGDYKTEKFDKILYDFIVLVVIAIAILLISGLLEVYVTPNFFK